MFSRAANVFYFSGQYAKRIKRPEHKEVYGMANQNQNNQHDQATKAEVQSTKLNKLPVTDNTTENTVNSSGQSAFAANTSSITQNNQALQE
jgi:hypothetical protein